MAQTGSLLTDRDITDQLKLGPSADLQIKNWASESITPVGYDVRAGELAFSLRREKCIPMLEKLEIVPGDTVFISSYESFKLSKNLAGITLSRMSLLLDGLNLTALSVDPTWDDQLMIIVTNQGQKTITIKPKEPLMTLCLFWVTSPSEKPLDKAKGHEKVGLKFKGLEASAGRGVWKKAIAPAIVGVGLALLFLVLGHQKIMGYENAATWWVITTGFYLAVEARFR